MQAGEVELSFLNNFVRELEPYRVASHKAWEQSCSAQVLKLDWNEATVPPSPRVKAALSEFLEEGCLNWYPDVDNVRLRNKISDYAGLESACVEYFAGSDAVHEVILRSCVKPLDTVAIVSPTYDNFRASAQSEGAKISVYPLDALHNFEFDIQKFSLYLEQYKPRLVYLCNPNNPTGYLLANGVIKKLLQDNPKTLFIVDEAYYEFSGITAADLLLTCQNLVVTRTFSKAFGLASFRVGYILAAPELIEGFRKIRNPKSISSTAQIAAEAALNDIQYLRNYVGEVTKARFDFRLFLEKFGFHTVGQDNGNFLLVNFGEARYALIKALESAAIYVRSCDHIKELRGFTRITIGTREQMQRVEGVMGAVMSNAQYAKYIHR